MGENYLEKALPFLKVLEEDRRNQFFEYFYNVPVWLVECFSIEKMEKGRTFIREGEPVDTIYFIAEGIIKATDYRIYGISFDFMFFTKVYALGGMEVIMGDGRYRTSLQTVTDCTVLKVPKSKFDKWMKSDIRALRHESKLMGEYLLEQARNVRALLFLQGADRLAMMLVHKYEIYAGNKGILKINGDRQELSDCTGLSVKTITRSVKKLCQEELITKKGNDILVNKEQYERLKENLAEILSDE